MSNPNQCRTPGTDLSVMIGWCNFNLGLLIGKLHMLAVLISNNDQSNIQMKNDLEMTTEMFLTVILRVILDKEGIKKEW